MDFLATTLVIALTIVKAASIESPPILDITPEDGSNKIFIAEKTTFNVTVKFPGKFYDDVIIDVMPTIDVPDVFITKVKSVKVGSSLYLTGNTKPVMDYGRPELQTPGKALSCQFHLGKVMKLNLGDQIKAKTSPEDDVILIQYEALIPEERSEGFAEVGHSHMYAVRVCTENGTYFEFKHVEVAARSLPILFRTLEKFPARQGDVIREMYINVESSEKKKFLY